MSSLILLSDFFCLREKEDQIWVTFYLHDSSSFNHFSIPIDIIIAQLTKMAEIKVRSLTGRIIPIDIDLARKVLNLKEIIEENEGIPPHQQKFLFSGKQLDDDKTLQECGVVAGSDLHLVLSLRGGN